MIRVTTYMFINYILVLQAWYLLEVERCADECRIWHIDTSYLYTQEG